jgi:amidophosphoribosyltransferase
MCTGFDPGSRRRARRGGLHHRVDGRPVYGKCAEKPILSPCIFEFVYLRPSRLDHRRYLGVYKARLRMGEAPGRQDPAGLSDHDIDVVIPIPDTSRTAALALANELGVNYREGFIKNRYIGAPSSCRGRQMRKSRCARSSMPSTSSFAARASCWSTTPSCVARPRSRSSRWRAMPAPIKVYFASAAPPVRYPNVYGIDMPAASELIAHGRSEDEVAALIGADRADLPGSR